VEVAPRRPRARLLQVLRAEAQAARLLPLHLHLLLLPRLLLRMREGQLLRG
jgi:hypothetical protein